MDFGHDDWVFESCLACSGILLHVAKDLHNAGVTHDHLDFWICHGVLHPFLVISCRGVCTRLNCSHGLCETLLTLSIFRFNQECFLPGFLRLVELLRLLVSLSFANPTFDEVWVHFYAHFSISQSPRWVHHLCVCGRSISVHGNVFRIASQCLIKLFECAWEISIFKELDSFFFMLLRQLRIEVSFSFLLLLQPLNFLHTILDPIVVVF